MRTIKFDELSYNLLKNHQSISTIFEKWRSGYVALPHLVRSEVIVQLEKIHSDFHNFSISHSN